MLSQNLISNYIPLFLILIDREGRLIPTKIKETIDSLKNPDHINKSSYMLPEIWLPNLG